MGGCFLAVPIEPETARAAEKENEGHVYRQHQSDRDVIAQPSTTRGIKG